MQTSTDNNFLGYLQGVHALNNRKGKRTLLVLRNGKRSVVVPKDIDHIIPSLIMSKENAEILKKDSEHIYSLNGQVKFEVKRCADSQYYIVHAIGPREMGDDLPNSFLIKLSNVEEMLKHKTKFPFSKVFLNENEEIIFSEEKASLDDLIEDTTIAFDAEWYWQRKKGIYSACIFDGNTVYAFTTLNFEGELGLDTPFTEQEHKIEVKRVKDEIELVRRVRDKINEIDPAVICMQNAMADFDEFRRLNGEFNEIELRKLKEIEERLDYPLKLKRGFLFRPGVDFTAPKKVSGAFFEKRLITGREIFDSVGIGLYFLSLINNQLPTITNYLFGTEFEKESYDILEDNAVRAEKDEEKAVEIIKGNALDTISPYMIYKKLEIILRRAEYLFKTDLASICLTSGSTLSDNLYNRKEFQRTNGFRLRSYKEKEDLRNLDIEVENFKLFLTEKYDLLNATSKGFYNAHIIYLTPLIKSFLPIINADKNARAMYEELLKNKDPIEKIIIAQLLNIFLREPYFDYKKFMEKAGINLDYSIHSSFEYASFGTKDWIYGQNYDIHFIEEKAQERRSANIKTINNYLLENVLQIYHVLKDFEIINYGRRYLYIKDEKDILTIIKDLEEKGLAIYLGKANVLSVAKNRIASKINDNLIAEGFSLDRNIADRTPYEKAVISEFVRLTLNEKRYDALKFIDESARLLAYSQIDKEDLEISGEAKLNYFDFVSRTDRIKFLITEGIKKGESFKAIYTEKGLVRSDEVKTLSKIISKYQERFFGGKDENRMGFSFGSISEVVSAAYSNADRKLLSRIFLGKSKPEYIDNIINPREQLTIF